MQTNNKEKMMRYLVELDVYRGASQVAESCEDYEVEAADSFSALSKAERNFNVLLPDDRYCVARNAALHMPPVNTLSFQMAA
jgi:hypothetical protein